MTYQSVIRAVKKLSILYEEPNKKLQTKSIRIMRPFRTPYRSNVLNLHVQSHVNCQN